MAYEQLPVQSRGTGYGEEAENELIFETSRTQSPTLRSTAVSRYFDDVYYSINFGRSGTLLAPLRRLFRRGANDDVARCCDIVSTVEPTSVLDLGCGTGVVLAAIGAQHRLTRATGVDVSAVSLARARSRLPNARVFEFEHADMRTSKALAGSYDVVLSIGMFDYALFERCMLDAMLTAARKVLVVTLPRRRVGMQRLARVAWLASNGVRLQSYSTSFVEGLCRTPQHADWDFCVQCGPRADDIWIIATRKTRDGAARGDRE